MNKDKAKQVVAFIGFPVVLGIFCVAFALWILPKNCTLFISNVPGPQMCHTIPMPAGCFDSFCKDVKTEFAASIIAGIGFGMLCIPAVISLLKNSRKNEVEQTKLFD